MVPYLAATWVMALATPEWTAPIRKAHCSWAMKRSATRVAVAGLVSVSVVIHSTLRPSTPPLALNSSIAGRMPSRSSWPLAPYWPLASQVRPSLIGLAAPWAQTRVCFHGPKKVPPPARAAAIRLPCMTLRREMRVLLIVPSTDCCSWPAVECSPRLKIE